MVSRPGGRFAFIDAGEAARMLGIDRVTLDQWVREGRIKPHRGVGREAFFRTSEVEALYNELHPSAQLAEAVAADERESAGEEEKGPVRKKQDHQQQARKEKNTVQQPKHDKTRNKNHGKRICLCPQQQTRLEFKELHR